MRQISTLNIRYWFGYIRKERTDVMIQVFNESLIEHSELFLSIQQFDLSNPDLLQAAVYDVLVGSIGNTVADGQESTAIIAFKLNRREPNFGSTPTYHVKKTPSVTQSLPGGDFLIELPSEPVNLKVAAEPFASGGMRLAYHAYSETHNKRMVLKRFKRRGERYNAYRSYLEYVEIQRVVAVHAEGFNRQKPNGVPRIDFLTVDVVDFKGEAPLTQPQPWSRWYTMEEYVSGEYTKYNNNTGYAAPWEDETNKVMQAFSHYTWVATNKNLVVCDLQGITNANGTYLTDPAIHAKEYWRFGRTNFGPKGIRRFFLSHICNNICRDMGLEHYPL